MDWCTNTSVLAEQVQFVKSIRCVNDGVVINLPHVIHKKCEGCKKKSMRRRGRG